MPFASADPDFREAVAFPRPHRLQRSRLADDGIARTERTRLRELFRPQTSDLFVSREDECERSPQVHEIELLDSHQRGGDETLRVARAAPVQLALALRERERLRPGRIVWDGVRVPDEREFDRHLVRVHSGRDANQIKLLHPRRITIGKHPRAQAERFRARRQIRDDFNVGAR